MITMVGQSLYSDFENSNFQISKLIFVQHGVHNGIQINEIKEGIYALLCK